MKPSRLLLPLSALVLVFIACRLPDGLRVFNHPVTPIATPTPTPADTTMPAATATAVATRTPAPSPLPPVVMASYTLLESSEKDRYDVKLTLPRIEDSRGAVFNQAVEAWAQTALEQFRIAAAEAAPYAEPSSGSFLGSDFSVYVNSGEIVSVRLAVSFYSAGAAHPGWSSVTWTADLAGGRMLALADLFAPGSNYLQTLAGVCMPEIAARDSAFWPEGAGPAEENYRSWNLTPGGLLITFDPYQVAPYAAGPQEVTIPYERLPGWRMLTP